MDEVGGLVIAGWGIMHLWGVPTVESIFVGAAMVATSVGITAQVLSAKGLLSHRASQVILAAAIIDDVHDGSSRREKHSARPSLLGLYLSSWVWAPIRLFISKPSAVK